MSSRRLRGGVPEARSGGEGDRPQGEAAPDGAAVSPQPGGAQRSQPMERPPVQRSPAGAAGDPPQAGADAQRTRGLQGRGACLGFFILFAVIGAVPATATERIVVRLDGALAEHDLNVHLTRSQDSYDDVIAAESEAGSRNWAGRLLATTSGLRLHLREARHPYAKSTPFPDADMVELSADLRSWRGVVAGQERAGACSVVVLPLATWPGRPQPGSHPRLLLRTDELQRLRNVSTDRIGAIWKQRLEDLSRNPGHGIEAASAQAVACGMLWRMNADAAAADRGIDLLAKDSRNWGNVAQVHSLAAMILQACLAWDLLHDRGDDAFHARFCRQVRARLDDLWAPQVGGFNDQDGSNWSAMYRSALLVAGLALANEASIRDPVPAAPEILQPTPEHGCDGWPVAALQPGRAISAWAIAGPLEQSEGDPAAAVWRPLTAGSLIDAATAQLYRKPHLEGGVDLAAASGRRRGTLMLATRIEIERPTLVRLDVEAAKIDHLELRVDGLVVAADAILLLQPGLHSMVLKGDPIPVGNHEKCESAVRLMAITEMEAERWLGGARRLHRHLLALREIDGGRDSAALDAVALGERKVAGWIGRSLGPAGWNTEGEAYSQHTYRLLMPALHALRRSCGRGTAKDERVAAALRLAAIKTVSTAEGNLLMSAFGPGGGPLGVDAWARGFGLLDPQCRSGCLPLWQATQAAADARLLSAPEVPVTRLDGCSAAFALVNWPAEATGDATLLGQIVADSGKDGYVLRGRYAQGDSVVSILLDTATQVQSWRGPDHGDWRWLARGREWVARGIPWGNGVSTRKARPDGSMPDAREGGSIVRVEGLPWNAEEKRRRRPVQLLGAAWSTDGSGVVGGDLSACLSSSPTTMPAVSWRRWWAVAHDGPEPLVAVGDRLHGVDGRGATWQLCLGDDLTLITERDRFTATAPDGSSLRGMVIEPAGASIGIATVSFVHEINYHGSHEHRKYRRQLIQVQGAESFLVLMTIAAADKHPDLCIEHGAGAVTCTVGRRVLQWDPQGLQIVNFNPTAIQNPSHR